MSALGPLLVSIALAASGGDVDVDQTEAKPGADDVQSDRPVEVVEADVEEGPSLLLRAAAAAGAGTLGSLGAAVVLGPYIGALASAQPIRDAFQIDLSTWQAGAVAVLLPMLVVVPLLSAAGAALVAWPLLGWQRGLFVSAGAAWGAMAAGTLVALPLGIVVAVLTGFNVFDDILSPSLLLAIFATTAVVVVLGAGLSAAATALYFPEEWVPRFETTNDE